MKKDFIIEIVMCLCNSTSRSFCLAFWALPFNVFPLALYGQAQQRIDKRTQVTRHNIITADKDLEGPAQVGNREFAFSFDFTGLLTFSDSANVLSDCGWYEFPLSEANLL